MNNKLLGKGFLLTSIIAGAYFVIGGCGGSYYYPRNTTDTTNQQSTKPTTSTTTQSKPKITQKPHSTSTTKPSVNIPIKTPTTLQGNGSYVAYPAMQQLIDRMTQKGFSRSYLQQTFSNIQRDNDILAKVKSPAEAKPWSAYRPIFITEQRINSGVGFWNRHSGALNAAAQRFGVDPEIIVAVIGVETLYGRHTGKYNVLRSLTTLAMDFPTRSKFYTSELEHFLQLTREENISSFSNLKGSYAGAMGMGQFISSSYRNFAVDFNNDKHKDLWHPVDAIGSVANYFAKHGWTQGNDVATPARIEGTSYAKIANTKATKPIYSLGQLSQYGVKPVGSINSTRVDLLRLQGPKGNEYWVTGDNFYTITRYNHSPKYAMAVYQLAQEIKRRKLGS